MVAPGPCFPGQAICMTINLAECPILSRRLHSDSRDMHRLACSNEVQVAESLCQFAGSGRRVFISGKKVKNMLKRAEMTPCDAGDPPGSVPEKGNLGCGMLR